MNAPCDLCEGDDVPTAAYLREVGPDRYRLEYLCPECFGVLESDGAFEP